MVTLQEIRVHNLIVLMPFLMIIFSIVLLHLETKLDKRLISHFLTSVILRILSIPILVYAPYWFFMIIGNDEELIYLMMDITGLIYFLVLFAGFGIIFIWFIENIFKNFLGVEIYIDGFKIKWGKYLK